MDKSRREQIEEFILKQIKDSGKHGIFLSVLGNRIRNKFGDFKVRDYGYSQFKQYIQSFHGVHVLDDGEHNRVIYSKKDEHK